MYKELGLFSRYVEMQKWARDNATPPHTHTPPTGGIVVKNLPANARDTGDGD